MKYVVKMGKLVERCGGWVVDGWEGVGDEGCGRWGMKGGLYG